MRLKLLIGGLALAFAGTMAANASAAEPLKIGVIAPATGDLALLSKEIHHGIDVYLDEHGRTMSGREIEIISKDSRGIAPEVARDLVMNLVNKDKVDVLVGFGLTPNAAAAAPIITQGKVPAILMVAADSRVIQRSPYFLRVGMTMRQGAWAMATWAAKKNLSPGYTFVEDFSSGHDAEDAFSEVFEKGGGEIMSKARIPTTAVDYSPYLQRVKDSHPKSVFFFTRPGRPAVSVLKEFTRMNLAEEGIVRMGLGDLTDEQSIAASGDAAIGMVTAFHYSEAHPSEKNRQFVQRFYSLFPEDRPNFATVAGYDGMHLIDAVLKKTGGHPDGDQFVAAARGMKWESPRGPIEIDPETRDVVQNEYIRTVKRVGDRLQNVEMDTFEGVH